MTTNRVHLYTGSA